MNIDWKDASEFARAAMQARDCYETWERGMSGNGDVRLPFDHPASVSLREAGERLAELGGVDAMQAALWSFYEHDEMRQYRAGAILNGEWNGIGGWLA